MPDTDFSRAVVVNAVIKRLLRAQRTWTWFIGVLGIAAGVWAVAMSEAAPEWLWRGFYGLFGSMVTLLAVRVVTERIRRQEGGT